MAFWIGLYPKPFFRILEQPVNNLVATVNRETPKAETTASSQGAVPAAPAAMQASVTPAAAGNPGTPVVDPANHAVTSAVPSAKGKN
jgi:hypothetical protein